MASELDLASIRERLSSREPTRAGDPAAAVATLLRQSASGPEVLFILRAEVEGDPWSGQMAFPGGRRDPGDTDLVHTAMRETQEELGVDLRGHGELISPLDDVPTHLTGLVVRPFVWALSSTPSLAPNHEVADVIWQPLAPLIRGEHDTTYPFEYQGNLHKFPAYDVEGRVVWGLTYRMLQILFAGLRGK